MVCSHARVNRSSPIRRSPTHPLTPDALEFSKVSLLITFSCDLHILVAAVSGQRPEADGLAWERPHADELARLASGTARAGGRERLDGHPEHPALDLAAVDRERTVHARKEGADVRAAWPKFRTCESVTPAPGSLARTRDRAQQHVRGDLLIDKVEEWRREGRACGVDVPECTQTVVRLRGLVAFLAEKPK